MIRSRDAILASQPTPPAPPPPTGGTGAAPNGPRRSGSEAASTRLVVDCVHGWSRDWGDDRVEVLWIGPGTSTTAGAIRSGRPQTDVTAVSPDGATPRLSAGELVERFGANSFDYVVIEMMLHPLSEIEILTALRSIDRLARVGVAWADVRRSRASLLRMRLSGRAVPPDERRLRVARAAAGFTPDEARDLAKRVDLPCASCRSAPWSAHFVLSGERRGGWSRRLPTLAT